MAQTDNSFLADKVALRVNHLPRKDIVKVLDCYAGKGLVWAGVQKITDRKILRLPIDVKAGAMQLNGNNKIFLQSLDLSRFDVIDLDAYGVPVEQLRVVFDKGYRGVVFVTFIQSIFGTMPKMLLEDVGIPRAAIEKIPTLFGRSGWGIFKNWLALHDVQCITHRSHARKHYVAFNCVE